MGLRTLHLALAPVALALVLSPAARAQQGAPGAGAEARRGGGHEAVLDQARADLSADERELVELREEMRQVRLERREAIQRARDSGDPHAMERVQEEFRPRMDAIRERVRASRDAVMETRLREHPEFAARLEARGGAGDRFECGGGPGHASDEARRRAFRRLQVLARNGSLAEPADIPTPVRQELQLHARRVALLQCVRERARAKDDTDVVERVRLVHRAEQLRHDRVLRELLGAPPSGRGRRSSGERTPAATTTMERSEDEAPARGDEGSER